MKKLSRYKISLEDAFEYLNYTLSDANTLSSELLKLVDFEKGEFFVLMPEGADTSRITQFRFGGLLPQNPKEKFPDGSQGTYQIKPTIRTELCDLIIEKMNEDKKHVCLFDDVALNKSDYANDQFFKNFGLFLEDEVYFALSNNNLISDNIMLCIRRSQAIWHSLGIIGEFVLPDKKLTLANIKQMCKNVRLLILGAYDGEAYIFWEPAK